MNRNIKLSLTIIFVLYTGFVMAKTLWRGEIMPLKKVCSKWGESQFEISKFKSGSETIRAQMACSLIKNEKLFFGKDRSEIRSSLGTYDGFYFTDMFPAYMIQSGKSHEEDSWQIVFFLDNKEKIKEIAVHKNCCDN